MEPSQSLPSGAAPEPSPALFGELVVQNGRQSGARRALSGPITLIGRTPGCDIRLNAKGVHLMHCALVLGPSGLVLRTLQEQGLTLVNGEPASNCVLSDGDLLSVGPFHFRVHPPRAGTASEAEALEREKDALRIQAAAVAAQQAALLEEENRLQQERVALERQKEQLAAHLEERRKHLTALREQIREARAALRKERHAHAEHVAELQREIERDRRENTERGERLRLRRERLLKLHRGLRRRWQRHWTVQEAIMVQRESERAQQRVELEQQAERLLQLRAVLHEDRLRLNGEIELGRRQMQEAHQKLAAERQNREQEHARQQSECNERTLVLDQRATHLAQVEHDLQRRIKQWERTRVHLEREAEGLEGRIRNQRRLLMDQQGEVARLSAVIQNLRHGAGSATATPEPLLPAVLPRGEILLPAPVAPPVVEVSLPEWTERGALLESMAAELADQRLYLAEQFERLLRTQECWRQERERTATELDAIASYLLDRERSLEAREQSLTPTETALQHRREEAAHVRCHLEAWRSRLAARETAWEGERETMLVEIAAREKQVQQQLHILDELRQRWIRRRQQEVEHLRKEEARCRDAFQRYSSLWGDLFRRHALLEQEQRALAEKTLSLEQYRLEIVGQAEDSVAAEKRLERLRRRGAALSAAAERRLARDHRALEDQLAALEELFDKIQERTFALNQRDYDRANRQTEDDREAAELQDAHVRLQQSLQSVRAQRDVYQWQLGRLREEVDRMALTILEESSNAAQKLQAA